jgi:hypothetical protein
VLFPYRDVTHKVKLVWLPLNDRLLALITLNCSRVLIMLLGFLLLRVQTISFEMLGLSTIVAKVGRKFLGLGNLLLLFLNGVELLSLSCF